ncbi:MAG: FAD-dependent oxidoreductase [Leptospiraceae bacterium]|nr:FAD-dependent oxidoreductase [Leptospiraceae bacterium]
MSRLHCGIVGGGYAGLTAAIQLSRLKDCKVTLLDRNTSFLKKISTYRLLDTPLSDLQIPYERIAKKHGFDFIQSESNAKEVLKSLPDDSAIRQDALLGAFDVLVFATGARTASFVESESDPAFTIESIITNPVALHARLADAEEPGIGFLGGGATSVQFAMQIKDSLANKGVASRIDLVTAGSSLLPEFPAQFGQYVHRVCRAQKITVHYMSRCTQMNATSMTFQRMDGSAKKIGYDLVFNFSGVKAAPLALQCNQYGQVLADGRTLENIYAIGDCSEFQGAGSNTKSAQSAVRKALCAVEHIQATYLQTSAARAYHYQDLGYFISLGQKDAIGWLLDKRVIATGRSALAIKEAIANQFALFLEGYNTYV